jgi:poly-gamma-glutamate capsule biosynthesis protein CapA/YwtB (metallophosphatase superfamily)
MHRLWYKFILVIAIVTIYIGLILAVSGPVQILTAGDVMLGSWTEDIIKKNGWHYSFSELDSILLDSHIFFVNLEAPFGQGGTAFEKTYTFQVTPDLVKVLKVGKINVVSLANNHIMDFGVESLKETFQILQENSIHYTGAGLNLKEARKPAILEVNGHRIAIASYSLTFPEEFWATDTSAGTCFPYHTFFYNDLKQFKASSDLLIISFHWGAELLQSPKEYQVELAHNAIEAGADIIIGHHPHVIQGIEIYKGKIIAYSLGNFIFGSYSEKARESMLLKFFYGTKGVERCKIYPINVYNKEVDFRPRLLTGSAKTVFFEELRQLSQELNSQEFIVDEDGWIHLQMDQYIHFN